MTLIEELSAQQFRANTNLFRLVSEAYRIKLAYMFDSYSAVHSSLVTPLPHQISAVYNRMLPMQPLRFLLADDPGAGKTIMTGLLLKELLIRGDVRRCLIVCPGALAEQWQTEFHEKFQLNFEILSGEAINQSTRNIFLLNNFCIVGIDTLARNKRFKDKLRKSDWDLIVCDEAHKMSSTVYGNKVRYTKRFQLGKLLGKITRHFLLLTATPHNGKQEDFHSFLSLIDSDRFEGAKHIHDAVDVSDIMRRLLKEDLKTFDGKPLFPKRFAYTVNYSLSDDEMNLYESVTDYVSNEFNRVEHLKDSNKKKSVGFAMTVLQRRLASSPEAIFKSLTRRTKRLEEILRQSQSKFDSEITFDDEDLEDCEEFPNADTEKTEEELSERVTAARNIAELKNEIQTLKDLTDKAQKVFRNGEDRKWAELSELLQTNSLFINSKGKREKLIIFTEHRDTLNYLQEKISNLFGRSDIVVTIHGGLNHVERHRIENQFKTDKNVFVLIATDAAGEGINLQIAHLMINYDLPWNPNRLEQRFGRIHRIGQTKICYLWNLVANETREGKVFNNLLKKIRNESDALNGKVFDVLGKISFNNKPLRDLLVEAVRHGKNQNIIENLTGVMDDSFNPKKIRDIVRAHALTNDFLSADKVAEMNRDMERGDISKLQPYFVENFFIEAFKFLNGIIYKRKHNRYEITYVPKTIRDISAQNYSHEKISISYNRICFAKENCTVEGEPPAVFIAHGHPLLNAVIDLTLKNFGDVLNQGTIFIDDNNDTQEIKLLAYIETKIRNGLNQILSHKLHFLEIYKDGRAIPVNRAPYFDYRAPHDEDELIKILSVLDKNNLPDNFDNIAVDFVATNILPAHLNKISADKKIFLDKLETEVRTRLQNEIYYWDERANEFIEKDDNVNLNLANKRADDLEQRLNQRIAEIANERKISADNPVVIGKALIVPKTLLNLQDDEEIFCHNPFARARIEKIAMDAVMSIERKLGYLPKDLSADKCGYDIESVSADKKTVRFIEVKGRHSEANTVTVSKNEIVTALNAPDKFILAIVKINTANNSGKIFYLKHPFTRVPDFNSISVNYNIPLLLHYSEIILDKEITF
ncbi:MAG: DUF3883 domain-containing protein [Selenomonadaceae bacterium]|nr:DUF3883 domain-containing protein [Selenomonadaceae bacterium]